MSEKYEELKIYCDGGSRGNPGPSAAGVVIKTPTDELVAATHKYLGIQTNNFAEYSAVIVALETVADWQVGKLSFVLDSELVVKQLNGHYKVKNSNIAPLYDQVQELIRGKEVSFEHVLRKFNKEADKQVNICLDEHAK